MCNSWEDPEILTLVVQFDTYPILLPKEQDHSAAIQLAIRFQKLRLFLSKILVHQ